MIFPNSAFLNKAVINYTYKNKRSLSTSTLMLKDTNDIPRARKIMLDIAKRHPDVIQEGKNAPFVQLDLKDERLSLNIVLILRCIIKDVDDIFRVNTEINARIVKACKKQEITLKI